MARTTAEAVGLIIEVDANISLDPFIEIANALVTQCCTDTGTDYTDVTLELIERWLSAHCYTIREGRSFREKAGSVSEEKQSKVDLGFDTSHYGQTAMRIDYQGGLATLNEQMKKGQVSTFKATWLGTAKVTIDD
jgi:hypothetical protein